MRARTRGLAAATAGLLAIAAMDQGRATEAARELASLAARKGEIATALAATIRGCVARRDTDHAAFHGCIDWHSAVHGTWALTAYGRMTGDRHDAGLLAAALGAANIGAERELLASEPRFEMPYGRAWFLRLAIEHKLATGSDALQAMAGEVLTSMLDYYRHGGPDPRSGSYDSASWALINMLDYARAAGNAAAAQTIEAWVKARFVEDKRGCDYALEAGQFMAVCTNWAWLVSKVLAQDRFDAWAEAFFTRSGMPQPVTRPLSWHHHGLNFSRAWGLWHLHAASGRAEQREAYLAAYIAHFREGYERPVLWRGSYEGVGHWVPQFGLLALQPLFGHGGR